MRSCTLCKLILIFNCEFLYLSFILNKRKRSKGTYAGSFIETNEGRCGDSSNLGGIGTVDVKSDDTNKILNIYNFYPSESFRQKFVPSQSQNYSESF